MPTFFVTSSGPFVIPPTAINPTITLWGGGGGGGGASYSPVFANIFANGGGGAGGYVIEKLPILPQTLDIQIGAGGTGGAGQNNTDPSVSGTAGTATNVILEDGTPIYALGGAGGNRGLVNIIITNVGWGGDNPPVQLPRATGYTNFGGNGGKGTTSSQPLNPAKGGNYKKNKGGSMQHYTRLGGGGGACIKGNGADGGNGSTQFTGNGQNASVNSGAGGGGGAIPLFTTAGGYGGNGGSGGVIIEYE